MSSSIKFFSSFLLLCLVFLGAFLTYRYAPTFRRSPANVPAPTPDPIPTSWKTYSESTAHLSLRYPLDHFSFGSYPDLAFTNLVHEQGFVMNPVSNPRNLYLALWTTLHVIDKKDPQIDSISWFLSSVGAVGDQAQIPNGDIFYAYDESRQPAHPLSAINMGGSILSQFSINPNIHQFGMSGGGYFIYSSVLTSPASRYFAILSLIIPVKNAAASADSQSQSSQALADYQLVVKSFSWQ